MGRWSMRYVRRTAFVISLVRVPMGLDHRGMLAAGAGGGLLAAPDGLVCTDPFTAAASARSGALVAKSLSQT